jgi:hypothetical protein
MNRRKKGKAIFTKRLKKARAKLAPKNQTKKPKYISKADRLKLVTESSQDDFVGSNLTINDKIISN